MISWLEECADKLAKDDTKERSALRIRKDPKLALVKHMLMIIFLLAVGTIVYSSAEGWSFEDAVYYTSATLSTVGYGDLGHCPPPKKKHARASMCTPERRRWRRATVPLA